jgi:RNA polymerase sigma factor (sigma-70 family)
MTSNGPEVLLRHIREQVGPDEAGELTDRDLLQRYALEGDESAFAVLLGRHGPMVLRVCRGVLENEHDAEDAFQAAFLVLARKAGAVGWQESVAGWLQDVAYRVARKARTTSARRRCHEAQAAEEQFAASSLVEASLRETQALLDEELARLPARYRGPVVLCYLEGTTQEEAARRSGWSLSTLKRRLRRGTALLQARLAGRGLAVGAVLSAILPSQAEASAALVAATVDAARVLRAGQVVGGQAVILADAVLKTMFMARLKVAALVVLAAAVLVAGVGLVAPGARESRAAASFRGSSVPSGARKGGNDNQDDHQLRDVLVQPSTTGFQLAGSVEGVAFSDDGSKVLSAGGPRDCTLRLWDVKKRKEVWKKQFAHPLRAVAVSRSGRFLVAGGDDTVVRLCVFATGNDILRFPGHRDGVRGVAITPNDRIVITAGHDGVVRLWDRLTGKQMRQLRTPGHLIRSLALSHDGKLLAVGCEKLSREPVYHPVYLWDLPFGREHPTRPKFNAPVQGVSFSPDGKTVACGPMDGGLYLWDIGTGKYVREFRLFSFKNQVQSLNIGQIYTLAFSPDGKMLVCGGADNTVFLLDARTGQLRFGLKGTPVGQIPWLDMPEKSNAPDRSKSRNKSYWPRPGGILSLAWTRNSRSLAVGSNQGIRLWDVDLAKVKPR